MRHILKIERTVCYEGTRDDIEKLLHQSLEVGEVWYSQDDKVCVYVSNERWFSPEMRQADGKLKDLP